MSEVLNSLNVANGLSEQFNVIKNSQDLTGQGKEKEYQKILGEVNTHLGKWKGEVDTETSKIEKDIESRRVYGEKLDSAEIAMRDYHSRQFKSKLAAEANSRESFLKVVKGMATHYDDSIVRAFVDNFHEVVTRAEQIFDKQDRDTALGGLRNLYKEASERIKPDHVKKYEQFEKEGRKRIREYNRAYETSSTMLTRLKQEIDQAVRAKKIGW